MNKKWDNDIALKREVWEEALRVAKPGATMLVFGSPRTYHRLACAIEDAGWILKDCLMWIYGCLSKDTEVLTDKGWEHYYKGIVNSMVLCYDVDNDKFIFQKPTKEFCYQNKYPAYRIQSNKTDQIVSRNHRVLIEREGKLLFQTAESLAQEQEICVPFLEGLQDLPKDISNIYERTNEKKSVLFNKVSWQKIITRKNGYKKKAALCLSTMWQKVLSNIWGKKQSHLLFSQLQWENEVKKPDKIFSQGQKRLDTKKFRKFSSENDWNWEPCLEGWSNLFQKEGKLWQIQNKICQMSQRIFGYGSERRLCYGTQTANGSIIKQMFIKNRGNSSQRPQPRKQFIRQFNAVQHQSKPQNIRRTTARIKEIEYRKDVWCIEVSTGAFVARRNGKIFITGNSGFPKSHNVANAIDKSQGMPQRGHAIASGSKYHATTGKPRASGELLPPYKARTELAKEWEGYGSALKPAYEPILLCVKENEGSYAENALKWKVAGLNIDGGRIKYNEPEWHTKRNPRKKDIIFSSKTCGFNSEKTTLASANSQGRFPSNIILECLCDEVKDKSHTNPECPCYMLDEQSGESKSIYRGNTARKRKGFMLGEVYGKSNALDNYGDKGGASRFFYCAKASRKERGDDNSHPTVKPISLIQYLCNLTKTPTGGIVLDPFAGSGTTGVACKKTGRPYILIEKEEEYVNIARARIKAVPDSLFDNQRSDNKLTIKTMNDTAFDEKNIPQPEPVEPTEPVEPVESEEVEDNI